MKFLALSSLLGMAFLAQQAESTLGFQSYVNDVFGPLQNVSPVLNTQSTIPLYNQGFQNLFNSINVFGNSQVGPTGGLNILGGYSSNLKTQPQPTTQPDYSNVVNQREPKNPVDKIQTRFWGIFDNSKKFCRSPRVWDGNTCKCPNNGCYLSGICHYQPPKDMRNNDILSLRFINRNFDGTNNNVRNSTWGSKQIPLQRLCEPDYADGKSQMWGNKPRPRDISNLAGQLTGPIKQSRLNLNMLFTIWGQFLDHDITLTPTTNDQKMNIEIPRCDQFMDPKCTGKQQIQITRSIYDKSSQVRKNINILTAWIDGSQIYGSDKATADGLRQFKYGKLKTSAGNLLPKDQRGSFIAGDFRVNQNVGLTCFQTIFMRQHNRLCDLILQKNPTLCDQEVFQTARNYVIGLVQHITFDEYLPNLLGKNNFDKFVGDYEYDQTARPNIYTQFSSAAFRLGHPMINSPFKLMDNWGKLIKQLSLGEMFFNPNLVNETTLNQFMNGLGRTGAKQRSLQLVHDLRNFLFFPPNAEVKIDLFSFNIQRGRDHGICSVKDARQKVGLPKKQFKAIFQNQDKAECLQKLYHDTDNLDLWLAIIGQKAESGSALGELGIRLNALQFKNIRNGDRLWYENTYPTSVIKQIKNTSFAQVIKRNSDVKVLNYQSFKKV